MLGWPGVKSVYTRVGKTQGGGQDIPEDVVGVIQYEFVDWRERKSAQPDPRRPARRHGRHSRRRRRSARAGGRPADRQGDPGSGSPPPIRPGSTRRRRRSRRAIGQVPGVIDISDGLPPPGVDWAHPGRPCQGGAVRRQSDCRSAPPFSSSPTG